MKNLIVFLLMIAYTSVFAQRDFVDGFVILISGDTLRGQINNARNVNNFRRCQFRATKKSDIQVFYPTEILAFEILGGKHFESYKVDSSASFLEVLVKGRRTLLRDRKNFMVLGDSGLERLTHTTRIESLDGKNYESRIKTYIPKLQKQLRDCPQQIGVIRTVPLYTKPLRKLFVDYHTCINKPYTQYDAKKPIVLRGIISIGLTRSSLTLSDKGASARYKDMSQSSFEPGISLTFGTGLQIWFPRVTNRIGLTVESWSSRISFQNTHTSQYSLTSYTYDMRMNATSIKFLVGPRFNIIGASNPLYVRGGMDLEFVMNQSFAVSQTTSSLGKVIETITYPYGTMSNHWISIWGAVGTEVRISAATRFVLECRWENTGASVRSSKGSALLKTTSLVTGLRF